jgi:hypothetical protein
VPEAKRPYRDPTPVRERTTRPKGPLVRRADDPIEDDERPAKRAETRAPRDHEAGVFSGMISPHPASSNGEWWAQVVLTLIGLPLLVSTFLLVGWFDSRRAFRDAQHGRPTSSPAGIAHPAAWCLGASPLALACFAGEVHLLFGALVIGVPFAALYARRRVLRAVVEREQLEETLRQRRRAR